MSKDIVVTANKVSRDVIPGHLRIALRKLITGRCSICTPLGLPVEPEVKIT